MVITEELLNNLVEEAKASPRKRKNYDLRTTPADNSQRMLNAIEPESVIPIHRHQTSTETVAVIRGAVRQNFYDEEGKVVESLVVRAGSSVSIFVVPKGAWHNSEALESGTIIFEAKDGVYTTPAPEDFMDSNIKK